MSQADMAASCLREAENCCTFVFPRAEYKPRTHELHERQTISLAHSHVFPCLSPQNPMVMKCEIHKLESGSVEREHIVWLEGEHTGVVPRRPSAWGPTHSSDVTHGSTRWRGDLSSGIQLHSRSHTQRDTLPSGTPLTPQWTRHNDITASCPLDSHFISWASNRGKKEKIMIIIVAALIMSRASGPRYMRAEPGSCRVAPE